MVVENKPGAAGQIGVAEVAKGAADGHAVVLGSPGAAAINMHLRKLSYDPAADLAAITPMAIIPTALAVNPALPVNTLAEFISYARERPGQLNFSISGVGSQGHLAGELLKARAGLSIQNIPFSGTAPATTAILSGQVQAGISDLTTLLPLAQDGRVRILAVVDAKRAQSAPQIPTVADRPAGLRGQRLGRHVRGHGHAAGRARPLERRGDRHPRSCGDARRLRACGHGKRRPAREFHLGEIREMGRRHQEREHQGRIDDRASAQRRCLLSFHADPDKKKVGESSWEDAMTTTMRFVAILFAAAFAVVQAGTAQAELKNQWVDYRHGDAKLKGYMAYDDKIPGKRPAVLVIHARSGHVAANAQGSGRDLGQARLRVVRGRHFRLRPGRAAEER